MKFKFTFLGLIMYTLCCSQFAQPFTDINPGGSNNPAFDERDNYIIATDDYLYFFANDGSHGVELWRSNGTVEGTHLVKDVNPGSEDAFSSIIGDIDEFIFEVGEHIIFVADDGVHGMELWITDGTEVGTNLLMDIYPGSAPGITLSTNYDAYVMNDILYFQGRDEENGVELWRTDGTAEGTFMIKNIRYLGADSRPHHFMEFNGKLYFAAQEGWIQGGLGEELYVTDGTEAGTQLVIDIANASDSSSPRALANAGDFFYFVTDDGLGAALWKTDGTEAGTSLVKEGFDFISEDLVVVNGNLFFNADDNVNGTELWTSDGTEAGTFLLKDIQTGDGGSYPKQFVSLNDKAYFIADETGWDDRLWVSDGTEAGTVQLLDDYADLPFVFNNELIFSGPAASGFGQALWHSDGTVAGSSILGGFETDNGFNRPSQFTPFQDKLFFIAFDYAFGRELWVMDSETINFVSNVALAEDYTISPNPADESIILDFSDVSNKELRIYNALGHLMIERKGISSSSISIETNNLQAGLYFTEIVDDKNKIRTNRFTIK